MGMRNRASGVACGLVFLLGACLNGALAEDGDRRIDEAILREMRTVKKVKLEVRQEYESADDETKKLRAASTAGTKGFLPLLALTRDIVQLAGWEVAATGEEGNVTLRVDVLGTPLGENYTSVTGGGPTGYHYTGARLAGSITLEKAGQTLLEEDFEAVEPVKQLISRSHSKWTDAPFQQVLPKYCAGIFGVLRPSLGSAVVLAGLEHKDAAIRVGALRTLVASGDQAAAPAFIRLLGENSDVVSRLAAWGAGALGTPAALPALLAALRMVPSAPSAVDDAGRRDWLEHMAEREPPEDRLYSVRLMLDEDDESGDLRQAILWALMQIDAPEKKELLRAAMRDPAGEFRANAVLLLGWSEGRGAREVLLATLRDSEALVRAAAVVALHHAGGDDQAEPLLEAAGDAEPLVRELAREALDELQDTRWDKHVAASALRPVHSARQNREFIAAAFVSDDPLVRAEALEIASEGGLRDHLPAIREIARRDKQPFLRREALEALADQHDPQSVDAVIAGLADPAVFVRQQALMVLSGTASAWEQSAPPPLPESVVEPLMALQAGSDKAGETVDAVLEILQRVQGPAGVRAMERLAGEAGPVAVRRQAVKFLTKNRPESTWPLLLEWAAQTDEGEFAYVLRDCLVEAGQPGMLQPLILMLKSDRRESRRLAADVLGRLNQPRAVGPLIAALQAAEATGPGHDEVLAGGARIALHALTGKEFIRTEEWRQWWSANHGTFVPKKD